MDLKHELAFCLGFTVVSVAHHFSWSLVHVDAAEQSHNFWFRHKNASQFSIFWNRFRICIQLSAVKYLLISLNFVNGRTIFEGEHDTVTEKDLEHLHQLLDNKESGDTAWQNLMERTTSNMTYKAWRREPEVCFACGIFEKEK